MKRRELLSTLAGSPLSPAASARSWPVTTQSPRGGNGEYADFLLVQYAESVKLADGKLTLMNVSGDLL